MLHFYYCVLSNKPCPEASSFRSSDPTLVPLFIMPDFKCSPNYSYMDLMVCVRFVVGFVAKEINPTSKNVFSGGQVFYDLVLPLQKWEPGIFPHAVNSTKTNFVGLTISPTCKIFSFATQYSMLAAELWLLMRTFICISACIPLTLPFSFAGLAYFIEEPFCRLQI